LVPRNGAAVFTDSDGFCDIHSDAHRDAYIYAYSYTYEYA
jgi:hypothetical protein